AELAALRNHQRTGDHLLLQMTAGTHVCRSGSGIRSERLSERLGPGGWSGRLERGRIPVNKREWIKADLRFRLIRLFRFDLWLEAVFRVKAASNLFLSAPSPCP